MVSVIILNYNGRRNLGKILENCLSSVFETDYPNFEVLFVDNASIDGSVDLIRRKYASSGKLRIIQNEQNLGFAEGNNVGIRLARGEYIALLNTDTRVDSAWLKELVCAIQPPDVGSAQSKLLLMKNPSLMDCAGGFIDQYGYHHYEVGCGERADSYNSVCEIFYAKGAGMILKREALRAAGLFDPKIFLFFDETDLCWRIRLTGFKVIFVPTSVVFHAAGETTSKIREKQRLYFSTRNHLLVLLKNYGAKNMVRASVVSVIWEIRNVGKFVLKRKPNLILSTLAALLWNLFNLKSTWAKRQVTQKVIRRVSDETIKRVMLKPFPPFPLSLVFSRAHYSAS
jgi:GT2 family glycosyltransferase